MKILKKSLYTADVASRMPSHVRETVGTLAIALSEAYVKTSKYVLKVCIII